MGPRKLPEIVGCRGGSGSGLFLWRDHAKKNRKVRSTSTTIIAITNFPAPPLPAIMTVGLDALETIGGRRCHSGRSPSIEDPKFSLKLIL